MNQPVPVVTRADVERVVRRDFAADTQASALKLLAEYSGSGEAHRVHLAVLKLSNGDIDTLRAWVATARQDYRDALAAAEYPLAFTRWPALDKATDKERQEAYDADWRQYQSWLTRP